MSAQTLGKRLGQMSRSVITVQQIAKLLNYIPDELEKDMICAYNFTSDPPYLSRRTAENARHLMSVILRYSEDGDTMERVAAWLGDISAFQLTTDAEEFARAADTYLMTDTTQCPGMTLF